jgi:hypothetical protein
MKEGASSKTNHLSAADQALNVLYRGGGRNYCVPESHLPARVASRRKPIAYVVLGRAGEVGEGAINAMNEEAAKLGIACHVTTDRWNVCMAILHRPDAELSDSGSVRQQYAKHGISIGHIDFNAPISLFVSTVVNEALGSEILRGLYYGYSFRSNCFVDSRAGEHAAAERGPTWDRRDVPLAVAFHRRWRICHNS